MSEKLPAKQVVTFLNEYFSHMVETVFHHGGILDKFMGDGIMAIFGAPIEDPNAPFNAVNCALAMREKLAGLNRTRTEAGLDPIDIGVAVNTGECVVGNIGTRRKLEYTAIGDIVNVASRIETLNKEFYTDILISNETYRAVKQRIDADALPPMRIKGKSESIVVYKVRGVRSKRA